MKLRAPRLFLSPGLTLLAWLAIAATAWADLVLLTPAGLNPGDKFRFIFVTSGLHNAAETDINHYNDFVNTQAGGATYDGSVVPWKVIGSTSTVNARDNVGGVGTNVPVYLVTGTKVANDLTTGAGGLWGGTVLAAPNYTISGDWVSDDNWVWTGSNVDGTKYATLYLGSGSEVRKGLTGYTTEDWISNSRAFSTAARFYGLSGDLTVGGTSVPEPGSLVLVGVGVVGWAAARRARRRASQ